MNMKSIKPLILPLAVVLTGISPALSAQPEAELDMTMTIIEEGQGPEGAVQRIQLPSPEEVAEQNQLPPVKDLAAETPADQVESEFAELLNEATEAVNDTVKNTLSIDGAGELPGNIVDNLPDELPLVDGITDDVDNELPIDDEIPIDDELPLDNPLGTMDGMMLDSVNEAVDVMDNIDESVGDSTDEAAGIIDEIDVDEAVEDSRDNVLEQADDILN